eukprot:g40787.t1
MHHCTEASKWLTAKASAYASLLGSARTGRQPILCPSGISSSHCPSACETMPAALPLVSASPLAPLKRNLARCARKVVKRPLAFKCQTSCKDCSSVVVEGFIVVFQNAADAPGCPDRNHQYLLPWVNLNLFFVAPPRRALYPTFPGYTFLPSSRRAAPRSQPAPVQEHLGRPLEPPSASEPASTPLACCTPWSGDPNDHTDGHRIIPCPWNRFHLCEVPMNRNHRIKLIPS